MENEIYAATNNNKKTEKPRKRRKIAAISPRITVLLNRVLNLVSHLLLFAGFDELKIMGMILNYI